MAVRGCDAEHLNSLTIQRSLAGAVKNAVEEDTMIKLVTLLTKRSGMSREAFIEHYETHHKKIGEKYLGNTSALKNIFGKQ